MNTQKSLANPSVVIGPNKHLIGGEWADSVGGERITVECPATKAVIAHTPRGTASDVGRAVQAAKRAFEEWRRVPPSERGRALLKIADDIEKGVEELAKIIAHETGNAIRTQARPEAISCAATFRYYGGLATELKGATLPLGEDILSYTRREPLGVVGAIIPWNAPAAIACVKVAPALAAGNSVVLKAAEDAPFAVLWIANICNRHLPAGVLNVLTGYGPECGAALVAHPDIQKMSFTGSTAVGRGIISATADRILPVSLELGGKSPTIVVEDANEEWAVEGVASAMRFTRQSQSCTAGSRLFIHERIYDSFLTKLIALVEQYKIGDPLDEQSDMGSLINKKQFDRVCGYIEDGMSRQEGRLLTGGLPPKSGPLSKGYFTVPTIFANAKNDWRLAREEIFGPVLVAVPWRDESDVVGMANDSHYGLAGFVFSANTARAIRIGHALDAGWIQINQGKGQLMGQPYGGFKESGLGKENALESLLESFTA
ncbi:aldehyde dehydrogenase family protein [Bradyrhizobium vignae]|uniref:aldehyde dehydrogenase family protein n=1 Tax=Bradyrhizobium vignae TaxID=1549949 RepID=UPI00100B25B9|nr:aldehyde dehydrogenase family protein [Bradyrhizobium vignae]RXH06691.1 aldehyde dehydrogenase family protein [Bradyrhizobium vignae]